MVGAPPWWAVCWGRRQAGPKRVWLISKVSKSSRTRWERRHREWNSWKVRVGSLYGMVLYNPIVLG